MRRPRSLLLLALFVGLTAAACGEGGAKGSGGADGISSTSPGASRSTSSTDEAHTSHTIALPTEIQPADLILVFFGTDGFPEIGWPEGWSTLPVDQGVTNALQLGYRVADGSEGSTITVTTTDPQQTASVAIAVPGAADPATHPPEKGKLVLSPEPQTPTPDPPSLEPSAGKGRYLWVAATVTLGNLSTSPPKGYSDLKTDNSGAHTQDDAGIGTAERVATAASEDPKPFRLSSFSVWIAQTYAIPLA